MQYYCDIGKYGPIIYNNIGPNPDNRKEKKQKPVQLKAKVKYQDLSQMTDEEAARNCNFADMRGRAQEPFPVKLHSIIKRSKEEFSTIISWAPHVRAFKIHNGAFCGESSSSTLFSI